MRAERSNGRSSSRSGGTWKPEEAAESRKNGGNDADESRDREGRPLRRDPHRQDRGCPPPNDWIGSLGASKARKAYSRPVWAAAGGCASATMPPALVFGMWSGCSTRPASRFPGAFGGGSSRRGTAFSTRMPAQTRFPKEGHAAAIRLTSSPSGVGANGAIRQPVTVPPALPPHARNETRRKKPQSVDCHSAQKAHTPRFPAAITYRP